MCFCVFFRSFVRLFVRSFVPFLLLCIGFTILGGLRFGRLVLFVFLLVREGGGML